jgi:hypothetical protein
VAARAANHTIWLHSPTNKISPGAAHGAVAIINVGANRIEARSEFSSDIRGHAMAYDAANHLIFLSGGREGKSKLVIIRNTAGGPPTDTATVARKR